MNKIYQVTVETDYDGRVKTVGYYSAPTVEHAAFAASKISKPGIDGNYHVEELEINKETLEISDDYAIFARPTYRKSMAVEIKLKAEIIEQRRKELERKISSLGLTDEQIREYLDSKAT